MAWPCRQTVSRCALAGADNRVRVYGPDLKLMEVFLHEGPVVGVAFHADGKRIVSASADKSLRLWTPGLIAQAAQIGAIQRVLITPDGGRISRSERISNSTFGTRRRPRSRRRSRLAMDRWPMYQ